MEISRRAVMAVTAVAVIAPALPVFADPQVHIAIEVLRESDGWGDWGRVNGGYAKGHFDKLEFAKQFVKTTDMDDLVSMLGEEAIGDDGELIDEAAVIQRLAREVRHCHAAIEHLDDDGGWMFCGYDLPGKNTFPATHLYWS